jgi:uncharacterized protein YkwD
VGSCWRARAARALGVFLCLLGGAPLGAASAQSIDSSGIAGEVFSLLNQQRAANGLPALHGSAALDNSAQSYSEAMMRATAGGPVFLSHTGPDGSTFEDRINAAGYGEWTAIGENIAAGQHSPQEVVDDWMNSPGHRANILDPNFRDVGIGIAVGPGTWPNGYQDPQVIWWTTDFGNSRQSDSSGGTTPVIPPAPALPSILGYTATDGTPINGAPPGTVILIVGANLGTGGTVQIDGIAAAATAWSATSISVTVPAAASYPSQGPVTVVVNGRSATGPAFTITAPVPPTPLIAPVSNPTPTPSSAVPQPGNSGSFPSGTAHPALPSPPAPVAGSGPTIAFLANGLQVPIKAIQADYHFLIRGLGFGDNATGTGRVLFVAGKATLNGATFFWSDDTIGVVAPYYPGPVDVVVQVDVNGTPVTSNRMPLAVQ